MKFSMNAPLTINFLLPHFRISGGVKAAMEYANRLQEKGHRVRLIAPTPRIRGFKKYLSFFRAKGSRSIEPAAVPWFPLTCELMEIPGLDVRWIPEADIHVATSWETTETIEQAARKSGKGFYLVQHHEPLWTKDKKGAEESYSLPLRKIVISTWLREIMQKEYGSDALLLVTPVNAHHFYPEPGTRSDPNRVAMLHHHYDWKGFPDAVEAIRLAREVLPGITPVVFGAKNGDQSAFYDERRFPCEYHFSPPVEQLRRIYSSCGIFLCSSWHEGLGMPAMEAMACGATLVTTDTGGCRDYAIPNETALVAPPRDPKGLAASIVSLVKDERLRKKLSENGMKKIKEFCWEENVEKMLEYFRGA